MTKNTAKAKNYQALSLELDEILAELQQPDVRVDEAVKLYERGLTVIAQLDKHLEEAENKITKLKLAAAGAALPASPPSAANPESS